MHNQYYEGILQLRNPKKEILEFINNELCRRGDVFITKEVKMKNGIDLYLTSQRYLQGLGRKMQQRFGGELKVSKRAYSTDKLTSKHVYRVNVLFRVPNFKKGDIIAVRGEQIQVISIGNKLFGKELKSGKKVQISYNKLPKNII